MTALIEIPYGYKAMTLSAETCEGAPAMKGTFTKGGNAYEAKFNRLDLINITAGDEVSSRGRIGPACFIYCCFLFVIINL